MTKYSPGQRGKCPHCQTVVQFLPPEGDLYNLQYNTKKQILRIMIAECPECQRLIFTIMEMKRNPPGGLKVEKELTAWPLSSGREPIPLEVPENIANDYNEAAMVLPFSEKSSAALSRRVLQTILSEAGGSKSFDLSKQIDDVKKSLPTYIWKNLDYLREIGNFATHEQKSINTGLVIDVEQGEAEWNLDVIDALFDFYYVKPALELKKREAFDLKIKEAGRKPLETE